MGKRRNTRWEDMDRSNLELSVLIQHYEAHNRTGGKSPRTVEWYNQVLVMLSNWLQSQRSETSDPLEGDHQGSEEAARLVHDLLVVAA